jgi:membrane associated rhomboid family serine protease
MSAERNKLVMSYFFPAIFIILIWLIKGVEEIFHIDLGIYGLAPLRAQGLIGIFTAPLLHASWSHLFANSVPLFVLGGLLFYFYKDIAWQIIILIWVVTGLWVWVFARSGGIHIGASGLVYGLASFLFFSGIFRRDTTLMAITLLVTFLYGGMVWGVFPEFFPKEHISWESHLMGGLCGFILALFYRKSGPPKKIYSWQNENGEDKEDDDDFEDGMEAFRDDPEEHQEFRQ